MDKWKELRIWLAGHGPAANPPMTADEAFNAALDKMDELDADEKRAIPTLKPGDKVRHKNNPHLGTGIVKKLAKSGVRAFVDFGEIGDWDQKKNHWKPWPAYYRLDLIIKEDTHE